MKLVKNIVKDVKNHEIIIGAIFILYLISGVETPYELAPYISNVLTYGILAALTVIIFMGTNPFLGILSGITFVVLVSRSNKNTPSNVMPSQKYRDTVMNNLNAGMEVLRVNDDIVIHKNGKTIEEEMVDKMTIITSTRNVNDQSVKSTLSKNHNAHDLSSDSM